MFHLGDITNRNTPAEWEVAARAMSQLDEKVPYFLTAGNHDYSEGGVCKDRTTRLNDYFPVKKFRDLATFGGTYDREPERLENSYHLFSAGDRDFLVICLEFGPARRRRSLGQRSRGQTQKPRGDTAHPRLHVL